MSVAEADDQHRGTVLHYAPRHVRYPSEERSIRPVLERLRRGESGEPAEAPVEPAVDLAFPLDARHKVFSWQMIACSILSAGLSAGLVVLATGWLAPSKTEVARIDSTRLEPKLAEPKIVQTASVQPTQAVAFHSAQASEADTAAADKPDVKPEAVAPPAKTEPQNDRTAPKELLAMWSGVPAEQPTDTPVAPFSVSPAPDVQEAQEEVQAEPPAVARSERAEPPPRRAHARRHGRARAHTVRRSAAHIRPAAAAEAQTPETNPLQSALQSIFGQPNAGTQQPNGSAGAPAQPPTY